MYLWHQIDSEGLHATADKVEAMVRAPIPKSVQELRSFLGLLNYYRKLFLIFASLLQHLDSATSKDATGNRLQNALRLSKLPKILYSQQRYLPIMIQCYH